MTGGSACEASTWRSSSVVECRGILLSLALILHLNLLLIIFWIPDAAADRLLSGGRRRFQNTAGLLGVNRQLETLQLLQTRRGSLMLRRGVHGRRRRMCVLARYFTAG
jgi:hypothetical protein